jgi:perosamine synthetase
MSAVRIPISKPLVSELEHQRVKAVLDSGWLTQGEETFEFERLVASYCGANHAVAMNSATTALHIALLLLGTGHGDEVIVPSYSHIATANAVTYTGAKPVFADIRRSTFNLDERCLGGAISERTSAIVVVHQVGLPVDLQAVGAIAERHGLNVVEDAACALGSAYGDRRIGGHGNIAALSFHPRKVITTGDGGMIATNNTAFAERLRRLRQHAMSLDDYRRHQAAGVLIEEYAEVGYNYRLTDVQAAIGIEQLKRLDGIVARRRELAQRYTVSLTALAGIQVPLVPVWAKPNWQSYVIRLTRDFPLARNAMMAELLQRGIASRRGIMAIHREPAYLDYGTALPITETVSDESLLLPIYPQMTAAEQDRVIAALFALGGQSHAAARAA